ncbi:hypothetical protein OVS_00220 [Mycoplasma ovis str. Michigan]|uniref:Lipoprotein n=1 Tax=Mycoplasma ovis str. Michigan TaxID=1415773 RepID=A0ABN4BQF2_9MOLU|nr:hypothetical protein [Mycoplasma ovis]AHC40084.1 hypothetical protein OVS_00220 [Mycoplasma ovis str. Michigan]
MSLGPKAFVLCSGLVGGSCVGVPFMLSRSSSTTDQSEQASNPVEKTSVSSETDGVGNCKLVDSIAGIGLDEISKNLYLSKDSYYSFSCIDTSANEISHLPKNWSGLFARDFFKVGEEITKESKINIKMNVIPENEEEKSNYGQVVFTGNKFASAITGEWGYKMQKISEGEDGEIAIIIDVTSPSTNTQDNIIYLIPS